jgi:hypothetical protein
LLGTLNIKFKGVHRPSFFTILFSQLPHFGILKRAGFALTHILAHVTFVGVGICPGKLMSIPAMSFSQFHNSPCIT